MYRDSAILLIYDDDDDYNKGYGQIKEASNALTKDDILQPYISDNDFRLFFDDDDIGYNLYVYEMRYQKNLESAHPMKVEINFDEVVPAEIYGYSLVLTNKWTSKSSIGQRHVNLF